MGTKNELKSHFFDFCDIYLKRCMLIDSLSATILEELTHFCWLTRSVIHTFKLSAVVLFGLGEVRTVVTQTLIQGDKDGNEWVTNAQNVECNVPVKKTQ